MTSGRPYLRCRGFQPRTFRKWSERPRRKARCRGEADDLVADYDHLVVDECHHVSAASFELAVRRAKAKYVLGPFCDGREKGRSPSDYLHAMRSCPLSREREVVCRELWHRASGEIKATQFRLPATLDGVTRVMITEVFAALAADEARNDMIFGDVLKPLEGGRSPLVLTERRDHLGILAQRFSLFTRIWSF
jgi:hypothetical protein